MSLLFLLVTFAKVKIIFKNEVGSHYGVRVSPFIYPISVPEVLKIILGFVYQK